MRTEAEVRSCLPNYNSYLKKGVLSNTFANPTATESGDKGNRRNIDCSPDRKILNIKTEKQDLLL